jgi:hypothetical protein
MPRPKTKDELQHLSQANFEKLFALIHSFGPTELEGEFPPGTLNRNIRDVLAHLHHWHKMMLEWYEVGMRGEKPAMPAKGYTWKTTSDLNHWIRDQYAQTPLETVVQLVNESHQAVGGLINKHSNEELFEKKRYPWTGSTSLGAYLISATSSHYDWAMKLIRKYKKSL